MSLCIKGNLTEEKIKWLIWARKKADWYDPQIEDEDDLLNDIDKDEIDKQKSNSSMFSRLDY